MTIIDLHFHLLATSDQDGCNLSSKARFGGLAGWLAGALLGTLDEELLELIYPKAPEALTSRKIWQRLAKEIREAAQVDGVVVLALDQIVDGAGNVLPSPKAVFENSARVLGLD